MVWDSRAPARPLPNAARSQHKSQGRWGVRVG
jgi:hypothetical protein